MDDKEIIQKLDDIGITYVKTGSRYICNPPVLHTDADFVIAKNPKFKPEDHGFIRTNQSDDYGSTDFDTFRNGYVNLIVVSDHIELFKWRVATSAARDLNLKEKGMRIRLFQGVLYGNW